MMAHYPEIAELRAAIELARGWGLLALDEGAFDHVVAGFSDSRRDAETTLVEHLSGRLSIAGLPQIIARSTAGSKAGEPTSANSFRWRRDR